ncbi:serine O-acetyltransferase EpsC [Dysgonomonas sp. 25]|uniref:serine O-acetyltransferase EpsC n=1 Tax=Dysgonomonas sp. 25 TaxID=2302933 RepID=UPI0013D81FCB|nr:serine O-acetyltransferase EpsC [Dysgonomonas sp. 25]NDV68110.1 serine acetyltransferase [Dysgonomonas sp. 25]
MTDFSDISKQLIPNAKCLSIDKPQLEYALDVLINNVLFPICSTETPVEKALNFFYTTMVENISALIEKKQAHKVMDDFMSKLPQIQRQLHKEAEVFSRNDPAANSVEEVIITYPGFFALTVYRIAHEFYNINVPIIPRLFSEYAHSKVGIDINPGAQIGDSFYIDHGTGIVIGESTIIGNNVTIYQGVTIGALFVTKELSNTKRHPTIEDNVVIYAGATILGGNTVIGHDSIIGGNAWITRSVVPYSLVQQKSEVRIRSMLDNNDPIEFYI